MNILDIQDRLKNFSEDQLVGEMQSPTGNAPQFLVLSELTRRKRVRDDFDSREGQGEQPTVAQEAVAAAGVPQEGLPGMAQAMAPQTDVTQNTGIGALPQAGLDPTGTPAMAQSPIGMAGGGAVGGPPQSFTQNPAYQIQAQRQGISLMDLWNNLSPRARIEYSNREKAGAPSRVFGGNAAADVVGSDIDLSPYGQEMAETSQWGTHGSPIAAMDSAPDWARSTGLSPAPSAGSYDAPGQAFDPATLFSPAARLPQVSATSPDLGASYAPYRSGLSPDQPPMPGMFSGEPYAGARLGPDAAVGRSSPSMPGVDLDLSPDHSGNRERDRWASGLGPDIDMPVGNEPAPRPARTDAPVPFTQAMGAGARAVEDQARPFMPLSAVDSLLTSGDMSGPFGAIKAAGNYALDAVGPKWDEFKRGYQGLTTGPFPADAGPPVAPTEKAADTKATPAADTKATPSADTETPVPADTPEAVVDSIISGGGSGGGGGGMAGVAGGGGGGGPLSSYEQELIAAIGRAEERAEQDKWLAVAKAGLALMSSKEPTLGGALGEAGMIGVSEMQGSRDAAEEQRMKLLETQFGVEMAREEMAMQRQAMAMKGRGGGSGGGVGSGLFGGMKRADYTALVKVAESRLERAKDAVTQFPKGSAPYKDAVQAQLNAERQLEHLENMGLGAPMSLTGPAEPDIDATQ